MFQGIITALVTPFKNDQVDFESVETLVLSQLADGVDGFVINGTTGESPNLNLDEIKEYVRRARKIVGPNFPIIVGTGSNSTHKTIEFNRALKDEAIDAYLVVVPYYNKPPQRGLLTHFTEIANQSDKPIILYDIPSRSVVELEVETVVELAKHENIVGIKDGTGNLKKIKDLAPRVDGQFSLLSGDDISCIEFIALGGHGVISVCSHIIGPQMKKILGADPSSWKSLWNGYNELFNQLYCEPNPIPVKKALQLQAKINLAEVRLPLVEMLSENAARLQEEMKKLNLM